MFSEHLLKYNIYDCVFILFCPWNVIISKSAVTFSKKKTKKTITVCCGWTTGLWHRMNGNMKIYTWETRMDGCCNVIRVSVCYIKKNLYCVEKNNQKKKIVLFFRWWSQYALPKYLLNTNQINTLMKNEHLHKMSIVGRSKRHAEQQRKYKKALHTHTLVANYHEEIWLSFRNAVQEHNTIYFAVQCFSHVLNESHGLMMVIDIIRTKFVGKKKL